jgi:hypothetical protein
VTGNRKTRKKYKPLITLKSVIVISYILLLALTVESNDLPPISARVDDFAAVLNAAYDKARAYVPLDKFKETVTAMHPSGYPIKVTAVGAAAVKGEKVVNVVLRGDGGGGGRFDYTLSLMGTAESGYRVRTFNGGGMGASG